MRVFSLFSGSSGNSTLVVSKGKNILIDVGVSLKRLNEQLLMAEGIDLEDINLILISHAHS